MRKTVKKLTSVILTAVFASSALSAGSSALSLCFGGNCFNLGNSSGCLPSSLGISLPSDCSQLLQILNGTYSVPSGSGCTNGQSCGSKQSDCTNGSCNTAQNDCTNGKCDTAQNDCANGKCDTAQNDCANGKCDTSQTGSTAAPAVSVSSDVSAVFELVNSERAKNGLSALTFSAELSAAAEIRAKEIVRSFSHTRPNGTSCFTVLKESGITYRAAGENLAYGQRTASAVMNGWMNSSGHRANILGRNFGKIGIACYTQNGVKYWVQLFTN